MEEIQEKSLSKYFTLLYTSGSFIAILLLGFIYSGGVQIYPPSKIPTERDPECSFFKVSGSSTVEQQYRGFYSIGKYRFNYPEMIGQNIFRLFVHGPHFVQEMRQDHKCGYYFVNESFRTYQFELNQLGKSFFRVFCLSTKLFDFSDNVNFWPRDFGYSRFYEEPAVDKLCWEKNELVAFSRSIKRSGVSNSSYLYPSIKLIDMKFQDYLNLNSIQPDDSGIILYFSNISFSNYETFVGHFLLKLPPNQTVHARTYNLTHEQLKVLQSIKNINLLSNTQCWNHVRFIQTKNVASSLSDLPHIQLHFDSSGSDATTIFFSSKRIKNSNQIISSFKAINMKKSISFGSLKILSSAKLIIALEDSPDIYSLFLAPINATVYLIHVPSVTTPLSLVSHLPQKIQYLVGSGSINDITVSLDELPEN